MTKNPQLFCTRDIYLAATLITLRFEMVGIDYQVEGQRRFPVGYFKFIETPSLLDAESMYWQKKLAVEPRDLFTCMRGLKTRLNNAYKSPMAYFDPSNTNQNQANNDGLDR